MSNYIIPFINSQNANNICHCIADIMLGFSGGYKHDTDSNWKTINDNRENQTPSPITSVQCAMEVHERGESLPKAIRKLSQEHES